MASLQTLTHTFVTIFLTELTDSFRSNGLVIMALSQLSDRGAMPVLHEKSRCSSSFLVNWNWSGQHEKLPSSKLVSYISICYIWVLSFSCHFTKLASWQHTVIVSFDLQPKTWASVKCTHTSNARHLKNMHNWLVAHQFQNIKISSAAGGGNRNIHNGWFGKVNPRCAWCVAWRQISILL